MHSLTGFYASWYHILAAACLCSNKERVKKKKRGGDGAVGCKGPARGAISEGKDASEQEQTAPSICEDSRTCPWRGSLWARCDSSGSSYRPVHSGTLFFIFLFLLFFIINNMKPGSNWYDRPRKPDQLFFFLLSGKFCERASKFSDTLG